VCQASGRKEQIARTKSLPAFAANIFPAAAGNEVHFIAGVRLLGVVTARRINFYRQAAMLKDRCESVSLRSGNFPQRVINAQ
jgi:hypothetical protein